MSGAKSTTVDVPADARFSPPGRSTSGTTLSALIWLVRLLLVVAAAADVTLLVIGSPSALLIWSIPAVPAILAVAIGVARTGAVRRPDYLLVIGGTAVAVAGRMTSAPALELVVLAGELAVAVGMTIALLAGARANNEGGHLGRLWLESAIVVAALTAWFVVVLPGSEEATGGLRRVIDFAISPVVSVVVFTPVALLLARLRPRRRAVGPSLLVGSSALLWGGLIAGAHPLDTAGWKADAVHILVVIAACGLGAASLEPSVAGFADGTAKWRRPRDWARTATLLLVPALVVGAVAAAATSWNEVIWPLLVLMSIGLLAVRTRLTADSMIARVNGRRSGSEIESPPLDLDSLLLWAADVHPENGEDLDITVIAAVPTHQVAALEHGDGQPASAVEAETARRIREVMRGAQSLDPFWRGEWALCLDRGRFLVVHLRPVEPAGAGDHQRTNRADHVTSAELLAGSLDRWLVLPFRTGTADLRVDFTIGFTTDTVPPGTDETGTQIQNAALAAQGGQPGRPQRYDAMTRAVSGRRAILAAALEDSLLDGTDLTVVFEPMVDVRTGRPIGAQARTRWRTPDGSTLGWPDLGELADQARAQLDLGEWQLKSACAAASAEFIQREIAVNLSGAEIVDPALYARVMRSLEVHQIDPQMLVLEIGESLINSAVETAADELRRLAAVGVKLSVDDFGTEASALSRLLVMPWWSLKLDPALIRPMVSIDSNAASLVRAVVGLCEDVGAKVVANGVDNIDSLRLVAQTGCDFAQGRVFGVGRTELSDAWADQRPPGFTFPGVIPLQY